MKLALKKFKNLSLNGALDSLALKTFALAFLPWAAVVTFEIFSYLHSQPGDEKLLQQESDKIGQWIRIDYLEHLTALRSRADYLTLNSHNSSDMQLNLESSLKAKDSFDFVGLVQEQEIRRIFAGHNGQRHLLASLARREESFMQSPVDLWNASGIPSLSYLTVVRIPSTDSDAQYLVGQRNFTHLQAFLDAALEQENNSNLRYVQLFNKKWEAVYRPQELPVGLENQLPTLIPAFRQDLRKAQYWSNGSFGEFTSMATFDGKAELYIATHLSTTLESPSSQVHFAFHIGLYLVALVSSVASLLAAYQSFRRWNVSINHQIFDLEQALWPNNRQPTQNESAETTVQNIQRLGEKIQQERLERSELLGTLGNDNQAPISGVIELLKIARREVRPSTQPQLAQAIEMTASQSLRLQMHMENVKEHFHMEDPSSQHFDDVCDLSAIAQQISVRLSYFLDAHRVSLRLDLGQLPPIRANESRLFRAMFNLVDIALRTTHQGYVELSAGAVNEHWVEVYVLDSGSGISPSSMNQLFEDSTTLASIGYSEKLQPMAISRRIIESLGGSFTVRTEVGKGSKIRLTLPIAVQEEKKYLEEKRNTAVKHPMSQNSYPRLQTPALGTVLVYHEDPTQARILCEYLSFGGYQTRTAYTIKETLHLVKDPAECPQFIITKMINRGSEEQKMLQHLRSVKSSAELPIIMILSPLTRQMDLQDLPPEVDDFLTQPFLCQELLLRLNIHRTFLRTHEDVRSLFTVVRKLTSAKSRTWAGQVAAQYLAQEFKSSSLPAIDMYLPSLSNQSYEFTKVCFVPNGRSSHLVRKSQSSCDANSHELAKLLHLRKPTLMDNRYIVPIRKMEKVHAVFVIDMDSGAYLNHQFMSFSDTYVQSIAIAFDNIDLMQKLADENEALEIKVIERTHELSQAKEDLEGKASQLLQSIEYARSIQISALPRQDTLNKAFRDHFVLWKPRDIVGGDFFWFYENEESTYIAVADCTGHGVPGGLIAMTGVSLLNRILAHAQERDPGSLLSHLNQLLKASLNQENVGSLSDDGMDIAICRIEKERQVLTFAGAHRPLLFLSGEKVQVIRGDRRSLGDKRTTSQQVFTNHEIPLQRDMLFYLLSDGFEEQIGGKSGIPYGHARFRRTLELASHLNLESQKEELSEALAAHMGEGQQIDDITVIGIAV